MTSTRPVEMIRSAAVLQVADVLASRDFYRDMLGFESANIWGEPPCFSIVGRGTVTVFLDQTRDPGPSPVNQYWAVYIYVSDVDSLLEDYRSRGIEIIRGPEEMPHGCREFDVRDPDGHIICFGQDLSPGPIGPGI